MTNAFEKLSEASPFWAGAIAACADRGFDAQGTQELLEKCAQADPILEEEYAALIKYAEGEGVPPVAPVAPVAPSHLEGVTTSSLPKDYVFDPHARNTVPSKTWGEAFWSGMGDSAGNIFGVIPDSAKAIAGTAAALVQGEVGEAADIANSLDKSTWERIKNTASTSFNVGATNTKTDQVARAINRSPSAIETAAVVEGGFEGLGNLTSGLGNAATTFVGGSATTVAAALELATRAASLGGENVTTEWTEAMRKSLYKQTEGALTSFISNIENAADPSKAVNYKPAVVKKIFDDAGIAPDAAIRGAQEISQNIGDEAAALAAFATLPGAAVAGTRAIPQMFKGPLSAVRPSYAPATLSHRLGHPFRAAGDYGRGMFRGPTGMFKSITPGTPTWNLLKNPNVNYGARGAVIPAGPNAASFPQSLAKATGFPHILKHTPLINKIPGAKNLATRLGVNRTGAAIGPLVETELAEQAWTRGLSNVYPDKQNPNQPSVFENLFGTREAPTTTVYQDVMGQSPEKRLDLINPTTGRTLAVKNPAEVWATGMNSGATPTTVFKESLQAYQDNASYPFKPLRDYEQPAGSSAVLPIASLLGSQTADTISQAIATGRPTPISPGDKHAAADFKGVLEGYLETEAADYFENNQTAFNDWAKSKTLRASFIPGASQDVSLAQYRRELVTAHRNQFFEQATASNMFAPEQLNALRGTYQAGVLPPQAPVVPTLRVPDNYRGQ